MTTNIEIDPNHSIIIYTIKNQICMRQITNDFFGRGIILANDYNHGLTTAISKKTIYYSYIDTRNNLVLKRLSDSNILYMKEDINNTPWLIHFAGQLLFISKSTSDACVIIKCLFPFRPNSDINITTPIPLECDTKFIFQQNHIYVEANCNNKMRHFIINTRFEFYELSYANNKEISDEIISLKKTIEEKETRINILEQTLDSATRQYNELMNIAKQYKEEAIKWCSKFTQ